MRSARVSTGFRTNGDIDEMLPWTACAQQSSKIQQYILRAIFRSAVSHWRIKTGDLDKAQSECAGEYMACYPKAQHANPTTPHDT